MDTRILKLPEVLEIRAKSRSSHYSDIKNGFFTEPVKLGLRAVGWPAYEVVKINNALIGGNSHDEIRSLVKSLMIARQSGKWVA